jgi:hypothetical protein
MKIAGSSETNLGAGVVVVILQTWMRDGIGYVLICDADRGEIEWHMLPGGTVSIDISLCNF